MGSGLAPSNIRPVSHFALCRPCDQVDISQTFYFLVVKSISLLELPPAEPDLSQVQAPADLRPHAHEAPEAGLTFSVAALSQEHWRAGFAPQEQVAFWAVCANVSCCERGAMERGNGKAYRRRRTRRPFRSRWWALRQMPL